MPISPAVAVFCYTIHVRVTATAVEMGMFKIFLIFEAENQRSREAEKLGKSRSREAEKQRKQI